MERNALRARLRACKALVVAVVAAVLLIGTAGGALASSPGDPDTTFGGGDGRATVEFDNPALIPAFGRVIAMQGAKPIVAGTVGLAPGSDIGVVRLGTTGGLDTSFGVQGKFVLDVSGAGSLDETAAVAVLPSNKILVAGDTSTVQGRRLVVLRLTSDGKLDHTFGGGDGIVMTSFGTGSSFGHAMAVMGDGRFLVCGDFQGQSHPMAVARYQANGSPDTTFHTNGRETIQFPQASDSTCDAIALQGTKIVLAGQTSTNGFDTSIAAARLQSNGKLDTTFGSKGRVKFNFHSGVDNATGVVSLAGNKVLLCGESHDSSTSASFVVVMRLTSAGKKDPTFGGGDGTVLDDLDASSPTQAAGKALSVQTDGKIVVAGTFGTNMFVARYKAGGTRDSGFGTNGIQDDTWPDGPGEGTADVIDGNGKILAAGDVGGTSHQLFAVERLLS